MASAWCSCAASMIVGDRLLDAEIDHGVAVVGQDDVDQVLADVVDIALDRGEHDGALAASVGLLHVRLEVGHSGLHHLGRLQHERQLHLAGAEAARPPPSCPRAGRSLMISSGVVPAASARSRSSSRPLPSPSMMRRCSRSPMGSAASSAARSALVRRCRRRRRAPGSVAAGRTPARVGAVAPVVDDVQRDLALLFGDPGHAARSWRRGRCRVEPACDALVQEHRVERQRAAGFRPKETLETPSVVWMPGYVR